MFEPRPLAKKWAWLRPEDSCTRILFIQESNETQLDDDQVETEGEDDEKALIKLEV